MAKELEDLEQEELDKELISPGINTHELPEVPSGDIKAPISVADNKTKGISKAKNAFSSLVYIETFNSFLVPAKVIEDDEDLNMLQSWAN